VAHSILPIFLLDEAARGEDTTFVFHRGVKKQERPTFLKERVGGFFLMSRNLKRHYGKGDPHSISLSCEQKKEGGSNPPFQKPKSKELGHPRKE